MNNRLLIILGVCAVAIIGFAIAVSSGLLYVPGITKDDNKIDATRFDYAKIITADNLPEGFNSDSNSVVDYVDGAADSKVVLIQWMNYQCSGCYSLSPSMREIREQYAGRVAFVERYLHLSSGHANGMAASVAAEAAAIQGKFFEMGDQLFINQSQWATADPASRENVFAGYAEMLGLDMDKWHNDYGNYEKNGIKTRLEFQSDLGIKNNVTYSPYILINGQLVDGSKDKIIEALDRALGETVQ